jgi:hypothetical protein
MFTDVPFPTHHNSNFLIPIAQQAYFLSVLVLCIMQFGGKECLRGSSSSIIFRFQEDMSGQGGL